MNFPTDYEERVYAGVLGKIIGVYLGRPIEGWSRRHIENELGEIQYYVAERRGVPLIVTDDDISGTFTFVRAFADNGYPYDVTPEQIGDVWLNYLIENKTVLWWGGIGTSTEHTAYLRLRDGIRPPESGSIATNGQVVAEQIGAQIFIDGWAMLCPGDPEKAAALARKAASVSHDGEAIYGAQVIAALEAMAFVEPDLNALFDTALTFIPRASTIFQLWEDLRAWHAAEPRDWRAAFAKVEAKYGYDTYGGGVHMVPNHAIIALALLYGDDDFQRSLMIANTCGWDTDCNSANVGCILGIKNGLAGIDRGPDYRGPVADRLYLPTADGGRCITDAVREAYALVNTARISQGLRPVYPKAGARFHFSLPGSVQGFVCESSPECEQVVRIENVALGGELSEDTGTAHDNRALAIHYTGVALGRPGRAGTATFTPPDALSMPGYGMFASPTLYPGQTVRARVVADPGNLRPAPVFLYVRAYGKDDTLSVLRGVPTILEPGKAANLTLDVPDTGGQPLADVGVEIGGHAGFGTIYLDWLNVVGTPRTVLKRPEAAGTGKAWRRAWVNACDAFEDWGMGPGKIYRMVQNRGTGLLLHGESHWTDYTVRTTASAHLASAVGVVGACRGLRRYVALQVGPDGARLVLHHDEEVSVLAQESIPWQLDHDYGLTLHLHRDGRITGEVDDRDRDLFLTAQVAPERTLGAIGLLTEVGHGQFSAVTVQPVGG
jgi:ADP-ribosylglycohydrolase